MPRSKALPAAGYTIRRYVKYLFQNAEGPLAVCPARSSRRQEGVLLQGHPRPWPVAKLRTLRVPAHKVQHRGNVVKLQGAVARPGCRRCASGLPPPALRSRQRSRPRSRCARGRLPCPPLPCWVVPPSKASSPAGRASSLLLSPLQGTASPCYTWPLFLHTSAGVNPARSVPGVQDAAVRVAAGCWRSVCPLRYAPGHTLRRWEPAPALRRCAAIRGAVPVRGEGSAPLGRWCALTPLGRSGPDPVGRLPSHIVGLFRCSREPEVSLPRRSRARRPPAQFRRPPPGPRSTRCARSAPLVTGRLVAGARNPAAQDPAGNETPSNQG